MSDSIPEECPGGPGSENAGKASACEGCPSRQLCESAPKGPDPDIAAIAECLKGVKRKFVILSGKGGVGKSTVTSLLARSFASDLDLEIGLLDIDITGPSQDLFMGVKEEEVHNSATGWTPVYSDENLAVMSAGFILGSDAALVWSGARKTGLMKKFLKEVEWGDLDYLLIDSPPGTSDEHLSLMSLLKDSGIDGGIIVTTRSDVALADVQRQITFCRKVGLEIIGVVENMAGYTCPCCDVTSHIFQDDENGVETLCRLNGLDLLGSLPLDQKICQAMDEGTNPMNIDCASISRIKEITNKIKLHCQ